MPVHAEGPGALSGQPIHGTRAGLAEQARALGLEAGLPVAD